MEFPLLKPRNVNDMLFTMARGIIIFVSLIVLTSRTAHAYLDPGTGSMIMQAVAGLILTATFTFKLWFGKLKKLFAKKDKSAPDNEK